ICIMEEQHLAQHTADEEDDEDEADEDGEGGGVENDEEEKEEETEDDEEDDDDSNDETIANYRHFAGSRPLHVAAFLFGRWSMFDKLTKYIQILLSKEA